MFYGVALTGLKIIIVIWECVPKRQGIASLDCDGNPLKQELCREWF